MDLRVVWSSFSTAVVSFLATASYQGNHPEIDPSKQSAESIDTCINNMYMAPRLLKININGNGICNSFNLGTTKKSSKIFKEVLQYQSKEGTSLM